MKKADHIKLNSLLERVIDSPDDVHGSHRLGDGELTAAERLKLEVQVEGVELAI